METKRTGKSIQGKKLVLILLAVVCAVALFMLLQSKNEDSALPGMQQIISDKDYWWNVAGFSEEEKDLWVKAGFSGDDDGGWAALFRSQDLSPEDALKERARWSKAGFNFITAQEWSRAGFSAEEAYEWNKAVGDAESARELKAQGLLPKDVRDEQKR